MFIVSLFIISVSLFGDRLKVSGQILTGIVFKWWLFEWIDLQWMYKNSDSNWLWKCSNSIVSLLIHIKMSDKWFSIKASRQFLQRHLELFILENEHQRSGVSRLETKIQNQSSNPSESLEVTCAKTVSGPDCLRPYNDAIFYLKWNRRLYLQ